MPDARQKLLPGEEPITTLEALISVIPTNVANTFRSARKGVRIGRAVPEAYGGCVQAWCINAAATTIPPGYRLYHTTGIFLSTISTTRHVTITVTPIRQTRTFQTCSVTATQSTPSGTSRTAYTALTDFIHSAEPESMTYSISPLRHYSSPSSCPDYPTHLRQRVSAGTLPGPLADAFLDAFGSQFLLHDLRFCPEGISFHNLWGVDRSAPTDQDALHITQKTSAWWIRSLHPFTGHVDGDAMHKAALVFFLDTATSYIPLTHSGMFFESITACGSLDVSVRFNSSRFRVDEWLLIELFTEGGGEGRTIATIKAWTERGDLVAMGTQSGIMRFKGDVPRVKL